MKKDDSILVINSKKGFIGKQGLLIQGIRDEQIVIMKTNSNAEDYKYSVRIGKTTIYTNCICVDMTGNNIFTGVKLNVIQNFGDFKDVIQIDKSVNYD